MIGGGVISRDFMDIRIHRRKVKCDYWHGDRSERWREEYSAVFDWLLTLRWEFHKFVLKYHLFIKNVYFSERCTCWFTCSTLRSFFYPILKISSNFIKRSSCVYQSVRFNIFRKFEIKGFPHVHNPIVLRFSGLSLPHLHHEQ